MKNLFLILVVLATIAFTSCRKDRTCTCTITHQNGTTTQDITTFKKVTKKYVRDQGCVSYENKDAFGNVTSSIDCKID